MALFIRHGKKTHANGKLPKFKLDNYYPLDPDLTEQGKILAKKKFLVLFKNELPTKIICSPYLRTRKTALIAQEVIYELTNQSINIDIDPLLSEYLHKNHVITEQSFHPDTEKFVILPEYKSQYRNRMKQVYDNKEANVLYITHGYNIQTIALCMNKKIKYPKEVCGILITDQISLI